MTRLNTPTRFNGGDAPRRVAVVHRQGDQFNVVLAEMRSGRAHIAETQSVPARDADRMASLLGRLAPERIIRVLPGGSVVCRVLEIPPLDDAAALEAASLQAEAELPNMLSGHRRAVAIMPWRTPMDNRIAVAFGWPGERPNDLPAGLEQLTYGAEAAALLELLIHSGINEGTIASLDRDHHSMELASHLMGVTTVRTARLGDAQWSADAARVVVETAMSAGADDATLSEIEQRVSNAARAQRQALVVDPELAQRLGRAVSGANSDTAWWNRFGVCVGAALAAMSSRHGMMELLDMAPQVPRGVIVSSLHWLGDRSRAKRVALLAVLVIIVAPILGGWTRYAILKYKTRNLEDVKQVFEERQAEADFFRTLRSHRWPMSKLLADVAGMAPYNLNFESINIDSSSMLTISGTAQLGQQNDVLEFHNQLNKSKLFAEVKSPNFTFGENKIEFELQAVVINQASKTDRPYNEPLAVVLYGDAAKDMEPGEYIFSNFNLNLGGGRPRPTPTPRSNPGAGNTGNTSGNAGSPAFTFPSAGSPAGGATAPSTTAGGGKPLPPKLTDDQIGKMNADEVQKALLARGAVKHLDPRLQEEWDKLLERKRVLNSGGSEMNIEEDLEP